MGLHIRAFIANIRLAWQWMMVLNTLVYFAVVLINPFKKFYATGPS